MVETNLRIVEAGIGLRVEVRRLKVVSSRLSADLLERACGRLRADRGFAAVPDPQGKDALIVAATEAIAPVQVPDDSIELRLVDGGAIDPLTLSTESGRELLPKLMERAVLATVAAKGTRWAIFGRPRFWHDFKPLYSDSTVSAFRRVAFGSLFVDAVGVGIAADIQTDR